MRAACVTLLLAIGCSSLPDPDTRPARLTEVPSKEKPTIHPSLIGPRERTAADVVELTSGWKGIGAIAVDGSNIYFATPGAVMKMPRAGGAPTVLAPADSVYAFAVDGTFVYWTDWKQGTVTKASPDGVTTILASEEKLPRGIKVHEKAVYWTTDGNGYGDGGIKAVSIDGGPIVSISAGQEYAFDVAVDDMNVYWVGYGVFAISRAGARRENSAMSDIPAVRSTSAGRTFIGPPASGNR